MRCSTQSGAADFHAPFSYSARNMSSSGRSRGGDLTGMLTYCPAVRLRVMAKRAGRLKIFESDRCRADRQDRAFHENARPALEPVAPCDQLAEPPHSRT